MDLFDDPHSPRNWLPYDGEVYYYGPIMTIAEADSYLNSLMESIAWRHDEAIIYGKHITTRRKVAWYGDQPYEYTYSRTTKRALPWTEELLKLRTLIQENSKETFNSCLLNLYHSGEESMGWHSDAEEELKKHAAIASVSLGAQRKFVFKHKKTKETIPVELEHGSLLIMKNTTQDHWMHALPATKKVQAPRVNLTFRSISTT